MSGALEQATGGGAPQPAESAADARRIALDGRTYTWPQFVEAYGDDAQRCWDDAYDRSIPRRIAHDGQAYTWPQFVEAYGDDAQRCWGDACDSDASQLAVNAYGKTQPIAAIDAPASPRGSDTQMTLHLYRSLTGEFIKTIHLPTWYGSEKLAQDMEEGVVTPRLKLEPPENPATHLRYIQLWWGNIELMEGQSLQFYVEEHGMPIGTVDIKVHTCEGAFRCEDLDHVKKCLSKRLSRARRRAFPIAMADGRPSYQELQDGVPYQGSWHPDLLALMRHASLH